TYAIAKLLHLGIIETDPDRRAAIEAARLDDATLRPVVDDTRQDSQAFGKFLHGHFSRSLELRSRDPIFPTDPLDGVDRVTLACSTELAELIELRDDLW